MGIFTDTCIMKMDRELRVLGGTCYRKCYIRMKGELKRKQRHGLTTSQLPISVKTLCENTYQSNLSQQTPNFPFYRCGQEYREVK